MNNHDSRTYQSYLPRLRWAQEDGGVWRASLEEVESGERRSFPCLEALWDYLCQACEPLDEREHEQRG